MRRLEWFSVAGPSVWNSLPDELGDPNCSADETCRQSLKRCLCSIISVSNALEVYTIMRYTNANFTLHWSPLYITKCSSAVWFPCSKNPMKSSRFWSLLLQPLILDSGKVGTSAQASNRVYTGCTQQFLIASATGRPILKVSRKWPGSNPLANPSWFHRW